MPPTERDWATIRREYEETRERTADICKRHAVSVSTLHWRARAENWKMRQPNRKAAPTASELGKRLSRTIAQRLDELEAARADAGRNASDRERDTRSLATLLRLQEKILELGKPARDRASEPVEWTREYRDRMEKELAGRLFAMLEQIRGAPLPDGP